MKVGPLVCVLLALCLNASAQRGPGWILDPGRLLSGVKQQLNSLAKQPAMLLGGAKDPQTLKQVQSAAISATKLFNQVSKKLNLNMGQVYNTGTMNFYVSKLSSLKKKLKAGNLDQSEKKLLNNMMHEAINSQIKNSVDKSQDKIVAELDKQQATPAAKLLLTQVITKKLSEALKKQLTIALRGDSAGSDQAVDDDDDAGVSDDQAVDDLSEADTDDGAVADTDNGAVDDTDDGADADTDDAASSTWPRGRPKQKKLCIYTPGREFCISQQKDNA